MKRNGITPAEWLRQPEFWCFRLPGYEWNYNIEEEGWCAPQALLQLMSIDGKEKRMAEIIGSVRYSKWGIKSKYSKDVKVKKFIWFCLRNGRIISLGEAGLPGKGAKRHNFVTQTGIGTREKVQILRAPEPTAQTGFLRGMMIAIL